MKRREFIAGLAGAAASWPISVRAQQAPKVWRIGLLGGASRPNPIESSYYGAFLKGMHELGYVENKDFVMEWRFADGNYDRLHGFATELAQLKVDVIVTTLTPGAKAAQQATKIIPIVMAYSSDPVGNGVVASFNRPGGNVTGINDIGVDIGAKRLGFLQELLPRATRFGVLVNPDNPSITESFVTELQTAASAIGRQIEVVTASTNADIDTAFATLVKKRADALLNCPDALFVTRRVQLITLAVRHALPALYHRRELAEAGGLMSYGSDLPDQFRQTGGYVGRILKGEKPADMPVQLPTRFEFVINLQTAKTLGLEIPPTLLARADEVIE